MIQQLLNVLSIMGYDPVHDKEKNNINFSSGDSGGFSQKDKDIVRAIMGDRFNKLFYRHDTQYIYYYGSKLEETFSSVKSELEYQEFMTKDKDRKDIIEDFHVGDALSAIQYNLDKARESWYKNATPHQDCMIFIRKITALCFRMGMFNGMPLREMELCTIYDKELADKELADKELADGYLMLKRVSGGGVGMSGVVEYGYTFEGKDWVGELILSFDETDEHNLTLLKEVGEKFGIDFRNFNITLEGARLVRDYKLKTK